MKRDTRAPEMIGKIWKEVCDADTGLQALYSEFSSYDKKITKCQDNEVKKELQAARIELRQAICQYKAKLRRIQTQIQRKEFFDNIETWDI